MKLQSPAVKPFVLNSPVMSLTHNKWPYFIMEVITAEGLIRLELLRESKLIYKPSKDLGFFLSSNDCNIKVKLRRMICTVKSNNYWALIIPYFKSLLD